MSVYSVWLHTGLSSIRSTGAFRHWHHHHLQCVSDATDDELQTPSEWNAKCLCMTSAFVHNFYVKWRSNPIRPRGPTTVTVLVASVCVCVRCDQATFGIDRKCTTAFRFLFPSVFMPMKWKAFNKLLLFAKWFDFSPNTRSVRSHSKQLAIWQKGASRTFARHTMPHVCVSVWLLCASELRLTIRTFVFTIFGSLVCSPLVVSHRIRMQRARHQHRRRRSERKKQPYSFVGRRISLVLVTLVAQIR